jgi:hypothetical protein
MAQLRVLEKKNTLLRSKNKFAAQMVAVLVEVEEHQQLFRAKYIARLQRVRASGAYSCCRDAPVMTHLEPSLIATAQAAGHAMHTS